METKEKKTCQHGPFCSSYQSAQYYLTTLCLVVPLGCLILRQNVYKIKNENSTSFVYILYIEALVIL